PIKGAKVQITQTDTVGIVALLYLRGNGVEFRLDLGGPFVGNIVVVQTELDFHARRAVFAQHLDDTPQGQVIAGRLAGDGHQHHLATAGVAAGLGRHDHVLADTGVVGAYKVHAALNEIAPHQLFGIVGNHLDDGALRATTPVFTGDPHQHFIAVKD